MVNQLTIAEDPSGEIAGWMPFIDGVSLVILVREYELSRGYKEPISFGGMDNYYDFKTPYQFLNVQEAGGVPDRGETWILGCGVCGDTHCESLYMSIILENDLVIWKDFEYGHLSPVRDYSGLGPFRFDRLAYNQVIEALW